jgi:hypothetical protein
MSWTWTEFGMRLHRSNLERLYIKEASETLWSGCLLGISLFQGEIETASALSEAPAV